MGGAYAAGHLNVKDCTVAIDGYDSDHGYVHNGGLVGMYIFYPAGLDFHGEITNNAVTGQITFFEDNTNRRAYCNGFIGEIMNWDFTNGGNTDDFTRNEVFDYSVNLRPHTCAEPSYAEAVTPAGCDTFGYTTRTCGVCGYSQRDAYTLFQHQWGRGRRLWPPPSSGLGGRRQPVPSVARSRAGRYLPPSAGAVCLHTGAGGGGRRQGVGSSGCRGTFCRDSGSRSDRPPQKDTVRRGQQKARFQGRRRQTCRVLKAGFFCSQKDAEVFFGLFCSAGGFSQALTDPPRTGPQRRRCGGTGCSPCRQSTPAPSA